MVVNLLAFKAKLDRIWRECFHKDAELGHALRETFETFMNKTKKSSSTWGTDNSKTGEMLAKYLDVLLRGGAKAIPTTLAPTSKATTKEDEEADDSVDEDAVVNDQLDQVLDLFRFVHGKAVFEAFYKKDLARRLLMGRSASADAERSMLARLKTGRFFLKCSHTSIAFLIHQAVLDKYNIVVDILLMLYTGLYMAGPIGLSDFVSFGEHFRNTGNPGNIS